MSYRIRFTSTTGSTLSWGTQRLADGFFYDFGTSTFVASGGTQQASLPEIATGLFGVTYTPTSQSQFSNGDYCTMIFSGGAVVAVMATVMTGGDDATVVSGGGSSGGIAASGVTVVGSLANAVTLSGLPTGKVYAVANGTNNQRLLHAASGEARYIVSQTVVGNNYLFMFGTGSVEAGPFSAAPAVGDVFYPLP